MTEHENEQLDEQAKRAGGPDGKGWPSMSRKLAWQMIQDARVDERAKMDALDDAIRNQIGAAGLKKPAIYEDGCGGRLTIEAGRNLIVVSTMLTVGGPVRSVEAETDEQLRLLQIAGEHLAATCAVLLEKRG